MFVVMFEFRLRLDDIVAVGEFHFKLPALPQLGGLFFFHGERFSVSDVITRVGKVPAIFQIECSRSYEKDTDFLKALKTLAEHDVLFEEEVLDLILAETTQEGTG